MAAPSTQTIWRQLGSVARARTCIRRWQSSYSHLETEMKQRKIRPIFEDMTPTQSYRLDTSLADFIPDTKAPRILPPTTHPLLLPLPHHLLYFEPSKPQSDLLPDGTNPDQSPGAPFHRRMWAGGTVRYNHRLPLYMDNRRGVCTEGIRSVTVKGAPGSEKIFVGIERRIAYLSQEEHESLTDMQTLSSSEGTIARVEEHIRNRLWRPDENDFGECSILERRNIVFMRDTAPADPPGVATEASKGGEDAAATNTAKAPPKILKPTREPDFFTHAIVPDEKLLFRFSALTFNAHAIHLDPAYCRNTEGHRDLLVHGPLSFTLLLTMLQHTIKAKELPERVKFVEYRNLAPLYCHEPLKLCGRKDGEGKYEIWAETPESGIAVRGRVETDKA